MRPSGSRVNTSSAANAMAGAVFRPFRFKEESIRKILFPIGQLHTDEIGLRCIRRDQYVGGRRTAYDTSHSLLNERILPANPQQLLGEQMRLNGQNLVPLPPAIITGYSGYACAISSPLFASA